jgi:hypothetical protein
MRTISPWCEQHEIDNNILDLMSIFFIAIQSQDGLFAKYMPYFHALVNWCMCLSKPTSHVTLR